MPTIMPKKHKGQHLICHFSHFQKLITHSAMHWDASEHAGAPSSNYSADRGPVTPFQAAVSRVMDGKEGMLGLAELTDFAHCSFPPLHHTVNTTSTLCSMFTGSHYFHLST